jgi:outer membrane protein OmpA-like peptidoglycan-associated protein
MVEQVEEGDLIFVVGYASTTGNAESNRVLSSDRATAAAQAVSAVKRPGQMVQAVYIGQTTRFGGSSPERNQICEIWHIKKK